MPAKIPDCGRKTKRPKLPDGFPLWRHPSGRWTKKVRGRQYYFGRVSDDPEGKTALEEWLRVKDDLLAGRTPRAAVDGITVRDLAFRFLDAKQAKVDTGELHPVTVTEYRQTLEMMTKFLGPARVASDVRPHDFTALRAWLAKGIGAVRLAKRIQAVRSLFKFGVDNDYITTVVKFGSEFKRPSAKTLRRLKAAKPTKTFTREEVRAMIDKADQPLKSWVLLGINAAFGQSDLAALPTSAIDLKGGWVTHPRPKTGAPRRCKLWSETVKALREALPMRPSPKDPADDRLCFLSIQGNPLVRFVGTADGKGGWTDTIGKQFSALLKTLKIQPARRGFYSLRHTHRTVSDAAPDRAAVDYIMGHLPPPEDMRGHYVHDIDDSRLAAVAAHVRKWLFAGAKKTVDSLTQPAVE